MDVNPWPLPGDSPTARLRRIAHAYRAVALLADPKATARVDALAARYGEKWITPYAVAYDDDELITRAQAADILSVRPNSISQLVGRGRLKAHHVGGQPRYRAGDIYELCTRIRARGQW